MRRIFGGLLGLSLSIISVIGSANPLMPSGPVDGAATKKQNALIGRTFSLVGGNAFGSGLVSVGFAPDSRSVVIAYFLGVGVDYGKATIIPDSAQGDPGAVPRKGDGLEIAYINCKSKTYSALSYPEADQLSNAERSWFVRGEANKWASEAPRDGSGKWIIEAEYGVAPELAQFFSDVCDATY